MVNHIERKALMYKLRIDRSKWFNGHVDNNVRHLLDEIVFDAIAVSALHELITDRKCCLGIA